VCWSCKELTNAQFGIIPKIMHPATYRTWILPLSRRLGFLHLTIHVRYVRGQTMLIKCCFVIIVMVDTIYFASSRNSLKFPPHLVLFIMFSYSTLMSTQTMPRFSRFRSNGGYMRISSRLPLVHYIYMCVCAFLFG
jgi:hypothetical protein